MSQTPIQRRRHSCGRTAARIGDRRAGATVGAHAGMPLGMDSGQGAGQAPITKEQKISMLEEELEQAELQLAQIKKKLDDMKK